MTQMALVSTYPSLCQHIHGTIQYEENMSLLNWLIAGCPTAWPNEGDLPMAWPCWTFMPELQVFPREMGMQNAIYIKSFEGPDMVPFTAGMWDCIIQMAPLAYYGTWMPISPP